MSNATILGLDVGSRRIGVAMARLDVMMPQPLTTLIVEPDGELAAIGQICTLATEHDTTAIVVGWPRGMSGQSTDQTRAVEAFVAKLKSSTELPVYLQDEALTSQKAEAVLTARKKPFDKAEVDALAATYILDDYLQGQPEALSGALQP